MDLNPRMEGAYRRLEFVYVHIGLFQESYEAAEKAAASDSSDNFGFSIGSDALMYQGDYEGALAVHRKFEKTPANNILTGYRIA
ncbi:MAG: hypothetical protein EXS36_13105 [Pedosphaera sp.]|nr:hypothetical protein [Pedosphaera sp.]